VENLRVGVRLGVKGKRKKEKGMGCEVWGEWYEEWVVILIR